MKPSAVRVMITAGFGAATLLLWTFVYNSGYGYDALEYLIIGQSLREGRPLYTFVPSKAWAIYALVASYFSIPGTDSHAGVATLVTALIVVLIVATYRTVANHIDSRAAWLAAALVGAASVFMEMQYLEPEGFVYLSGLGAFAAISSRTAGRDWRRWSIAGLWIGAGLGFKAVGAFYGVGIAAWVALRLRQGTLDGRAALRSLSALAIATTAMIVGPMVYFALTGRLFDHLEWSYFFPLLRYPSHTEWLAGLFTKLLWVWTVIGLATLVALQRDVRVVFSESSTWLLLIMGGFALVPLLKTQASHYAFPGAAFLLIYAATILTRWSAVQSAGSRKLGAVLAATMVASIVSVLIYRPHAWERLVRFDDYQADTAQQQSLQRLIAPDQYAIFLTGSTHLYWISRRYPNWCVLNTDVQTSDIIARHSDQLLAAFDDPKLVVVEYDPRNTSFDDSRFLDRSANRAFLQRVTCRLERAFDRRDDLVPHLTLWLRKAAPEDDRDCSTGSSG